MAQLVTTAVIRASDQLTGPLAAIAARVRSTNAGFKASAAAAAASGRTLGAGLGVGMFSIGAMLEKAQEFNKAIFGIGAGQLVDEHTGEASVEKAMKDMKHMSDYSLDLSKAMGFSSSKIAQIGEVFVKAGMKDNLENIMKATVTLSKADTETPAKHIADFMHTLTQIHETDYKKGPGNFIRAQADMILTAADQTKLSVGTIMQGMKQFQTIGAGMGMGTKEMLAMLMVGNQKGFSAEELGTAYKSNLVRLFKPTREGMAALNQVYSTMGTSLADYTAVSAQNPQRAFSNLTGGVAAGINSKGFSASLKKQLFDAERGGYQTSDAFIDRLTNQINRAKNITDAEGQFRTRRMVQSAITTTAEDAPFNVLKLLQDMKKAKLSPAQMASVFQGQHLARNKPLMDALLPDKDGNASRLDQYMQLLDRMKGQGLDAVETLWSNSAFGNFEAMKAAFERLMVRMANTPAIQQLVNGLENVISAAEKIPAKWALIAGGAAVFGMLAGPVKTLGVALWGMAAASTAAALGMARMGAAAVMAPFAAAATGMASMATAMRAVGAAGIASMFAGLGGVATVIGGITVAVVGLGAAIAGLALWNTDWEKALSTTAANQMKEQFESMRAAANGLVGELDRLVASVAQWMGTDMSTGPKGWDKLWGMLREDMKMIERTFNFLQGKGYKTKDELEEAERNGEISKGPPPVPKDWKHGDAVPGYTEDPSSYGMSNIGQQIKDSLTGAPMKIDNLSEDGIASKTSNPIVAAINALQGVMANLKVQVIGQAGTAANAPTPATPNPGSYRGK